MRVSTYCHCECGQLVRLARIGEDTPAGSALAAHAAQGYAGACPACRGLCQLTLTAESPILRPTMTVVPKEGA